MIFSSKQSISAPQKMTFSLCVFVAVCAALFLMAPNTPNFGEWLVERRIDGDLIRRALLSFCLVVYFIRLEITVWIFQKRTWSWIETAIISILIPLALFAFAKAGGNNQDPIGLLEILGMLLYLAGSYLNTASEYSRYRWKFDQQNQGKVYTEGWFKYATHINYSGDLLLFFGFAMVARSLTLVIIPVFMTANFVFGIIPTLDKYLENKYGEAFRTYSSRTKKLVPFVY